MTNDLSGIYDIHPSNFNSKDFNTIHLRLQNFQNRNDIVELTNNLAKTKYRLLNPKPYGLGIEKIDNLVGQLYISSEVEDFSIDDYRSLADEETKEIVETLTPHLVEVVLDKTTFIPLLVTAPENAFIFVFDHHNHDGCIINAKGIKPLKPESYWNNAITSSKTELRFYDAWATNIRSGKNCCTQQQVKERHRSVTEALRMR